MDLMENRPAFDTETAAGLAREHYGIEGRAIPLPGERDQNFAIESTDGTRHVLKIANRLEDRSFLEAQNRAMSHLARTVEVTPRITPSPNGDEIVTLGDAEVVLRALRHELVRHGHHRKDVG